MYETVVNQTPWPFRHFPRSAILKGLAQQGCGTVTEPVLMQVCQEVTPEKYLDKTMDILERMKTTPTAAAS